MSGLRRRECRRHAAHPLIHASLQLTKAGTDAVAAGEASLLFYAVSTKDTDAHFEKSDGSLSLTRGIEAGPIEIDAHAQSRQRILADPVLLEMEWNGSGAIGILPSALDAKTLPSNDEPINATTQEESADKEAGAGDTPSPTNSVPASFEAPNEPLPIQTIPSSRTVWGLLILKKSMKVTAACLPRSTTRRSSTLRTSKLPPPISRPQVGHHRISRVHRSRLFAIGRGRGPNTAHPVGRQEYSKRN